MSLHTISKLIAKKRQGKTLSEEDINFFIDQLCRSSEDGPQSCLMDPCQIGAMVMAIYIRGLNLEETRNLTRFMKSSGFVFSWPDTWRHLVVDKHSTGGVGDKVSLVLAPALAAVGLKVPMISGRSLGHTGGTLDKLESIPGYKVELSTTEIIKAVETIGCCIVGQADDIVPADRILYRCRDLTATVDHQSLIIASIVSKKLAEGTSALVYDVKFGTGSLMETQEKALELANALVLASSGESKCRALLTCVDSPIGHYVGNTLEVLESVQTLRGKGPADLIELVEELGGELLFLTNQATNLADAKHMISQAIGDGRALKKFFEMIQNQGVSEEVAYHLCYGNTETALPMAPSVTDIRYQGHKGRVDKIDAMVLAEVCRDLTNGSQGKDLTAGLAIRKHLGDEIETGDVWLQVHHSGNDLQPEQTVRLHNAIVVKTNTVRNRNRVYRRIFYENGKICHQTLNPETEHQSF